MRFGDFSFSGKVVFGVSELPWESSDRHIDRGNLNLKQSPIQAMFSRWDVLNSMVSRGQKPSTRCAGPRTRDHGPRTGDQGPRARELSQQFLGFCL